MEFKLTIHRCVSLILLISCLLDTALSQADTVRLVGGETENEGTVEIFHNNEWGTICDYRFTSHDAYIICHQLGYFDVIAVYPSAHFGEGTGPILWDLKCHGHDSELKWTDCYIWDWNTTVCMHSEDVGVRCHNVSGEVTDVRLVDGETELEGRVEIFYRDEWGTVCDSKFSLHDGHVICQQLGYLGAAEVYRHDSGSGAVFGPIAWNFNCYGVESELKWTDCYVREWNTNECSHGEDTGLRCNNMPYPEYDVRLVDGKSEYEGRVELFYYGQWGTVCDDDFDTRNGDVICRQLGFPRAAQIFDHSYFGEGKGPMLRKLNCSGDEIGLGWKNCTFDDWDTIFCSHSSDAGLSCVNSSSLSWNNVRLINAGLTKEARLEIYHDNKWGTVCDNDFTLDEANVICRQLGYVRASHYYNESFFGEGYGPIMEIVDCVGDESNWTDCEFRGWGTTACTHSEDVGLQCTNYADLSEINDFPVVAVILFAVGFVIFVIAMVTWALCVYMKKRTATERRRQKVLSEAAKRKQESAAGQPMVPTSIQNKGEDHPPGDKDAMM